jgi:hypothetical protein
MTLRRDSRSSLATNRYGAIVGTVLATICLDVGVARATPASEADALIDQGIRLRVQGKNAEALELFKQAHLLAPTARTFAQVGLAEGALHQWLEAEDHIVAALSAHDTPWIENPRNREALDHALAAIRGHIGRVAVSGPAGAEITVNGKPSGRLPLSEPVRVAEGAARIEARAPGRRPGEARVEVAGGATMNVALELPLIPPPPVVTAPIPSPSPLAQEAPRSRGKTWAGASFLVASAAALATGIVWLVVDGDPTCSAPSGTVCEHLYDTKTQGWIAIAGGAAAGLGGGLLLWQSRAQQARVGLGPAAFTLAAEF